MNCKLKVCSDKYQRLFDIELLNGISEKYPINYNYNLGGYVGGLREYDNLEFLCSDKLSKFFHDWMISVNIGSKSRDIILYGYNNTNIKLIGCYPVGYECSEKG